MMSLMGDQVTTKFFHRQGDDWVETEIRTDFSCLKRDNSNPNAPEQMNAMGALSRIDYNPKTSVWSSSIGSNTLKIDKTSYYEAAL